MTVRYSSIQKHTGKALARRGRRHRESSEGSALHRRTRRASMDVRLPGCRDFFTKWAVTHEASAGTKGPFDQTTRKGLTPRPGPAKMGCPTTSGSALCLRARLCSGIVLFDELGAEFFFVESVHNFGDDLGCVRRQSRTGGEPLLYGFFRRLATLSLRHNPASAKPSGIQYHG